MFAGTRAARRAREVDDEADALAPAERFGRGLAVHGHLDGPEGANGDHERQRAPSARASARRRAYPESAPAHSSATRFAPQAPAFGLSRARSSRPQDASAQSTSPAWAGPIGHSDASAMPYHPQTLSAPAESPN